MSKRADRRALDRMLRRCGPEALIQAGLRARAHGQQPGGLRIADQLVELSRIYHKAAAGLQQQDFDAMPQFSRGFVSVPCSTWGAG